jgi:hypothetical protein
VDHFVFTILSCRDECDHHLLRSIILPAISITRDIKVPVLHQQTSAWVDEARRSLGARRVIERNVLLVQMPDMNKEIGEGGGSGE